MVLKKDDSFITTATVFSWKAPLILGLLSVLNGITCVAYVQADIICLFVAFLYRSFLSIDVSCGL